MREQRWRNSNGSSELGEFVCVGGCVLFSDSQCACVHVPLLYVCCAGVLGKVKSCSSQDRKPLISTNENRRPY